MKESVHAWAPDAPWSPINTQKLKAFFRLVPRLRFVSMIWFRVMVPGLAILFTIDIGVNLAYPPSVGLMISDTALAALYWWLLLGDLRRNPLPDKYRQSQAEAEKVAFALEQVHLSYQIWHKAMDAAMTHHFAERGYVPTKEYVPPTQVPSAFLTVELNEYGKDD